MLFRKPTKQKPFDEDRKNRANSKKDSKSLKAFTISRK
jgi:hypothetical protein